MKQTKNQVYQTGYFKLENCKNQVQINRGSGYSRLTFKKIRHSQRFFCWLMSEIRLMFSVNGLWTHWIETPLKFCSHYSVLRGMNLASNIIIMSADLISLCQLLIFFISHCQKSIGIESKFRPRPLSSFCCTDVQA